MNRRGQTMVLFALTLLLLVLMVMMTLSIGAKAKEKMELQTMADAAAYSNAVATARTFNSVSLMNRALMGHMVAMTGVESLISWSGHYRGSINALRKAYGNEPLTLYTTIAAATCPCAPFNPGCAKFCKCSTKAIKDINKTRGDLQKEDNKLNSQFNQLDKAAGLEARGLQIGTIADEQKAIFETLQKDFKAAKLAQKIVDEAKKGVANADELEAAKASASVNDKELDGGNACAGKGAACTRRSAQDKLHFVDAAMGSRGHAFTTARSNGGLFITAKLNQITPKPDIVYPVTNEGSGYFPKSQGSPAHSSKGKIDATEVWGDDHGSLTMMFLRAEAPCVPMVGTSGNYESYVRSNDTSLSTDKHTWLGSKENSAQHHTMGDCTACPGMWPSHMDYNFNLVTQQQDNWGQPKNYAVIQRDYAKRMSGKADPWNLMFNFRLGAKSETFDNRGIKLTSDGTDISKATALSTGIAYYKREGDFWQEPPNFLNPFWRATLVSAHVDKDGEDTDVAQVLGKSNAAFTKEAYEALKQSQYEGW